LESEIDMPKAHKLYEQAAAITYASEGDPPTWLGYSRPNGEVTDDTPLGAIVHHPKFGIALKERLDGLGVECVVQYEGQEGVEHVTESQFIRKQFDLAR
jgi:hypothetical protein